MPTDLDPNQTSWNLALLFPGTKAKVEAQIDKEKTDLQQAAKTFVEKWSSRTDYLENPSVLREALDDYETWRRSWSSSGRQGFYLALSLALDQNNSELKAQESKLNDLAVGIENDVQFFTHRVARIDPDKQATFLSSPDLQPYHHFLEILFAESQHLLGEEEEKVMNLKHFPAHAKWVQMLESFLSQEEREILTESGQKEVKNFSQILTLSSHKQKAVRDSAAAAFNDILAKHIEVGENEINAVLQNKKINDELRNFSRPDATRHLSDDVDSKMVDELVKAVTDKFEVAKDFYELKAQLLGLPKLAYHERNVEYGEIDVEYPWPEAAKLVAETFDSLDPKFAQIFDTFLAEGRIDVFPKKGKDSGAFCAPARSNLPVYVMLNHTNKLNDVRTLAHEMGHAINFEMMRHENELNYDGSLFLAESCSTFMEDFVLQKVIEQADQEQQLAIMMEKLNSDVSTIFRQIAFYNFETQLHADFRSLGYLSHQQIGEIFAKHTAAYMGDYVEQSPGSQNWWLYVGHFRRFFYVYSYAGGLLVSKFLQKQVKHDHGFMEKVKTYYSTGLSKSPRQILADLGVTVNANFWSQGLAEVEELLAKTKALAKELGKL